MLRPYCGRTLDGRSYGVIHPVLCWHHVSLGHVSLGLNDSEGARGPFVERPATKIPAIESNDLFTRSFIGPYLLSLVAIIIDIQAPRVVTSNPTTPLHIGDNWLYFAPHYSLVPAAAQCRYSSNDQELKGYAV